MAFDLLVVMGATARRRTMPLYLDQLAKAGIEYRVETCTDKPNIDGGGNLGYRVKKFKEWAHRFSNYELLVFSDAFDVTFYGTKEEVISKIPRDRLTHAGEKNCYPNESWSLPIPDRGPWRYANGGLVAGTPEHFKHWCAYTERHRFYDPECLDQHFLNLEIAEGVGCLPDFRTELFFCLFGGYEELDFEKGLPINTLYGTHPNFLHANGGCDPSIMFAKYERSL